jgi:DNA polymerase III sliding clamp (beta) subunit (PCNA family)
MMLLGLYILTNQKDKLKASSSNSDEYEKEESKEPDYGEAEDQLEKLQIDQRGKITTTATNRGNKSSLLKVMEWMSMYLWRF